MKTTMYSAITSEQERFASAADALTLSGHVDWFTGCVKVQMGVADKKIMAKLRAVMTCRAAQ